MLSVLISRWVYPVCLALKKSLLKRDNMNALEQKELLTAHPILQKLKDTQPVVWFNEHKKEMKSFTSNLSEKDVLEAEKLMKRFQPFLRKSFPELVDYTLFAQESFKRFFSQYAIGVASTGNLGLSIGIMSAKLGFKVSVYMSRDAKQWKKELLRYYGAHVYEFDGDFSHAIAIGRDKTNAQ